MARDLTTEPDFPPLPDEVRGIAEELVGEQLLGASRGIRRMHDLLVESARYWSGSPEDLVSTLVETTTFFIATRGRNTPAVGNVLAPLARDLERVQPDPGSLDDVRGWLERRRDTYNLESLRNAEAMAEYGANVLFRCESILAFDYSSTMMAILERLAQLKKRLRIVVPESRCLDGGRPIADEATDLRHSVVFVPDMAFGYFMDEIDAVLIGAETILADGSCWNTIGSYPLAELASIRRVPFYVATELIKMDPKSYVGATRPIQLKDFGKLMNYPSRFRNPERVTVVGPDLDVTPGRLITNYITPVGVLLPEHLRAEARAVLEVVLP